MFLIAGDPEINPQFVDIASTAVVLLHKKDNRWDEKTTHFRITFALRSRLFLSAINTWQDFPVEWRWRHVLQVSRGPLLTRGAKHWSQDSSSSGLYCLHCLHCHSAILSLVFFAATTTSYRNYGRVQAASTRIRLRVLLLAVHPQPKLANRNPQQQSSSSKRYEFLGLSTGLFK